ncbi:MAG: alpha/beta hydrolase [Verrucomicrobiota bacterium]|nr:alpha/beta hydrolase [Verrucomicrobiota bacterium]
MKKKVWHHPCGDITYWRGGHGKQIVLIHGLGGSTIQDFANLAISLSSQHEVISLDLPGFGLSRKVNFKQSIENHVALVHDFLKIQGIKQPVLIGNSMGGWITMSYCLTHPGQIEKIILLAPAGIDFDPPPPEIFLPEKTEDMNRLLKYLIYHPPVLNRWILRDWYHFMANRRDAIQDMINQMLTRTEILSEVQIRQINQSTLIIFGINDRIIPSITGEKLHQFISNSELVIYADCGHLVQATHFKEVLTKILDFLSNHR